MTKIATLTRGLQPRMHIRPGHALLLLVAVLFVCMTGLVGGTAWADAPGEIPNLSLSSNAPGELTITWNAPATTPEDYRVAWAKNDLSYLAWDASNETHRGSAYPSATATSHTLTGLTNGATYKVRMRSRYNTGTSEGWSGPWTTKATVTVSSPPPPPPPPTTPVPTVVPTAVPTVVPPSDEVPTLVYRATRPVS